jgi:hypothetical protein
MESLGVLLFLKASRMISGVINCILLIRSKVCIHFL